MSTALALSDPVAEVAGQPGGGYFLLGLVSKAGWSLALIGTGTGRIRLTAVRGDREEIVEGESTDEIAPEALNLLAPELFQRCFGGGV